MSLPKVMSRLRPPGRKTAALIALICGGVASITSCNSLFKVKPMSALPPLPATAATANVGSVTFRAAPLLTDEETQELFESNLQVAGLLPVRVEVLHNGGGPVATRKLKWRLRDSSGSEWKMISAKNAISRILKANQVFNYNPNARKAFEKEFRAYELDLRTPLTHGETRRHGLIIFLAPQKQPVESPKDLLLTIEGLPQLVTLKLN